MTSCLSLHCLEGCSSSGACTFVAGHHHGMSTGVDLPGDDGTLYPIAGKPNVVLGHDRVPMELTAHLLCTGPGSEVACGPSCCDGYCEAITFDPPITSDTYYECCAPAISLVPFSANQQVVAWPPQHQRRTDLIVS